MKKIVLILWCSTKIRKYFLPLLLFGENSLSSFAYLQLMATLKCLLTFDADI